MASLELNTVKTEVLYGSENAVNAILRFQSNIKKTWCECADKTVPALSAGEKLRKGYNDGKARGIDQEILPKLFTKFVTKSDKGTGLGLYLSRA